MLVKSKELKGCKLEARDGDIGHLKDFYFDDHSWTMRYLVVNTGHWLPDREVLISPFAVTGIRLAPHKAVEVNLTRQQIEQSPAAETHQPISRQFEARYFRHFGWPYYWQGPLLWGPVAIPSTYLPYAAPPELHAAEEPAAPEDVHLRSANEVVGYALQALDHHFGQVEEFISDDLSWAIRYLVADTHKWWPGKRVLLAPQWISEVSWRESRVHVDCNRDTISRAPAYDPTVPITREYETKLFAHYNREPYWTSPSERSIAA